MVRLVVMYRNGRMLEGEWAEIMSLKSIRETKMKKPVFATAAKAVADTAKIFTETSLIQDQIVNLSVLYLFNSGLVV
jgi:hypothetical protein